MRIGNLVVFGKAFAGKRESPWLVRYVLFSHSKMFGVMLHRMKRSDYEQNLHDHPWPFISIVLKSGYREVTSKGEIFRKPGSVKVRSAEWKHRVVIDGPPAWTLVFTGPRVRRWGYWTPTGWCWWRRHRWGTSGCEDEVINEQEETIGN